MTEGKRFAPIPPWVESAAAVLLPVLAGLSSLAASWERWINPLVDSGREMDVPWRLLQGERLYHDITYYYGPLGPWLNALALKLLGGGWMVLHGVCIALSIAILALLYRLVRQAGSRLAAIAATTLAAALCLGAPNGGAYVFPYSISSLWALAGSLLALSTIGAPVPLEGESWRWRQARVTLGALGLATALASRVEVGTAALAVLVLAGVRARPRRGTRRAALQVVAGGFVLAAGVYALALHGLSWRELCEDGPLTPFTGLPAEWQRLYLQVAGLNHPVQSAGRLGLSLALDAALLAWLAFFALPPAIGAEPLPADGADGAARSVRWRRAVRPLLFPAASGGLLALYLFSPIADPLKNLPPLVAALPLLAATAAVVVWLRQPLDDLGRARFLLFGFAAALAARVFLGVSLGPRMSPYYSVPMPGLLAAGAVLAFDLLAPRLVAPRTFRLRLAALFLVVGCLFLYRIERVAHLPNIAQIETANGALRLPRREALAVDHALRYLQERAHPGDTLTAFPESGFFNFLTGLRNPLRQDEMVPGVLFGRREAEAARRIERAGPRFVLLCNRPTSEYGPVSFGRDYDVQLWTQVQAHYDLTATFGWARPTAPVGANHFFIRIYERRADPWVSALRLAQATRAPHAPAAATGPFRSTNPLRTLRAAL